MRAHAGRKLTRFYVINPISDRRIEARFESRESVVVKLEVGSHVYKAFGCDIGRYGLKLEIEHELEMGSYVQVAFPNANDNTRCFGRVVWTRPLPQKGLFESGLSIEAWHGIVDGDESWKKFHGADPKNDRRNRRR